MREDLFRSTLEPVEKVLRDSKIDKANVHEIVLVGGSTRIPQIVKLVSWMSLGDSGSRSNILTGLRRGGDGDRTGKAKDRMLVRMSKV